MKKFKFPFFGKKGDATAESVPSEQEIISDTANDDDSALNKGNGTNIYRTERFSPSLKEGLSNSQVNKRVTENLTNTVNERYSKSYWMIIFENVFTFFNLLGLLCTLFLIYAKSDLSNYFFVIIYIINMLIGITQEIRAKLSIDKLSLINAYTVKTVREGVELSLRKDELVLDDIVVLSAGDQIPCDCILKEGYVEVNESALTGEAIPVKKAPSDSLYAGSFISGGTCIVQVDKVGSDSYIQKLTAKAKKYRKPSSTLMISLKKILSIISIMIIPITLLMFLTNYSQLGNLSDAIIKTSTVTIGLIPCGMFLLTTLALAVGVLRLAKKNTLVKDLYSLEMLARINVLCLDKTGTITNGKMNVKECIPYHCDDFEFDRVISSLLSATKDNNQTAVALKRRYHAKNIYTFSHAVPFSSKRKFSAATFNKVGTFILGAPEFLLSELPEELNELVYTNAAQGYRVLLLAHSKEEMTDEELPRKIRPIAVIVLEDMIREESVSTIKWFKDNGVTVKIISGDNPAAVADIARRVGVENSDKYISLAGFSTQQILNVVNNYTVFGRVTPEQKAVLVKAMRARGNTVGMMGDGVNDILAMKEAACSITVSSGSQATRDISHIVLTDNNFEHLSAVVGEGRRVVNNVERSSSLYLMKTLFTAIFAVISILTQTAYPFEPKMMVMLEVFVIGFPSFALSLQANSEPIRGNFMSVVFSNALPGALLLVFNVYIMQFVCNLIGLQYTFDPERWNAISVTLTVTALTMGGITFLYKICQPFNTYRAVLFALTGAICIFWFVYLKSTPIFGLEKLFPFSENWPVLLLLFALFEFDFFLIRLLIKLTDKVKKIGETVSVTKEKND